MNSMRGNNFMQGPEDPDEEWFGYGSDGFPSPRPSNYENFRNERYSNAYGDYRGGYGPINNSGGFGPINSGGFGPRNMGPPNFIPPNCGPQPLFPPEEMPFMMGRGFGPRGPSSFKKNDDRVVRYLVHCGLPRDSVKSLPKAILRLMEPQQCSLCGLSFNSYPMSRLHYISKNHSKNIKKWVSQEVPGKQNPKEVPLRARELYCELCDVYLTSKSHADSHYAGKPHRAIVEGRKMPKNPVLLQRGMSSRLEQLIRREKKNLKNIEETEDATETPKEPKITQPELYCEICKTSVTCTEQMTMHLNGKRHLAKEKQHILRIMKGEPNLAETNQTETEEDGGEEDVDAEMEKGAEGDNEVGDGNVEGGEDDYDWGNGSGTWDEPETQHW